MLNRSVLGLVLSISLIACGDDDGGVDSGVDSSTPNMDGGMLDTSMPDFDGGGIDANGVDSGTPMSDAGSRPDVMMMPSGPHRGIPAPPAWSMYEGPADETLSGSVGSSIRGDGTADDPYVFSCEGATIRNDRENWLDVEGEYVIVRDCVMEDLGLRMNAENSAAQNVDITGGGIRAGADYVVVMDSTVNGYVHPTNDRHGLNVGCGNGFVWFLNMESSGNSGDGFQSGHGCDGNRPHDIYIGGLTCVNNRENCIDTKYVERVVFSGIDSEGHSPTGGDGFSSGSDGSGGVIGSDGDSLGVWIIDSEFRDNIGVRVEDGPDATLVGNNLLQESRAIALQKHGEDMWVIDTSGTGTTFIGRPDRDMNFLIRLDGNTHPGEIDRRVMLDETPLAEGELETRFRDLFGFDLE